MESKQLHTAHAINKQAHHTRITLEKYASFKSIQK